MPTPPCAAAIFADTFRRDDAASAMIRHDAIFSIAYAYAVTLRYVIDAAVDMPALRCASDASYIRYDSYAMLPLFFAPLLPLLPDTLFTLSMRHGVDITRAAALRLLMMLSAPC